MTSANVRSTLGIFWNCIFTLLICTWSVLHLSVPPQEDEEMVKGTLPRLWAKLEGMLKPFWTKFKWMVVTLFLPEYLVGRALGELYAARYSFKRPSMTKLRRDGKIEWSKTHAFYANMGGFVMTKPNKDSKGPEIYSEEQVRNSTSHHLRYINWNIITPELTDSTIALNSAQLCVFLNIRLISDLGGMSEKDIKDKSKGDLFVKGVSFLQILWLVIQLINRKIRDLPSTQLEIATLSYSLCTLLTYLLWWKKPQDVRVPTRLAATRKLRPSDRSILYHLSARTFFRSVFLNNYELQPSKCKIENDSYAIEAPKWQAPNSREDKDGKLAPFKIGEVAEKSIN